MIGDNFSMSENQENTASPRFYFREWRKFRGLTQQDLAAKIGLQAPSISQLERGQQGFTGKTLVALAEALECSPAELLIRDPSRDDSLWSLWERAEKTEGVQRKTIISLIKTGLGDL